MIDPNWAPHGELETDVKEYLEDLGFWTAKWAYHDWMPDGISRLISRRWSYTALYLRARADRIAIHKKEPLEFEWDPKTHANAKYGDIVIEALPLAHHIWKSWLGVRCLIPFRDPNDEQDYGFWIDDMPPIREIHIPRQRWGDRAEDFKAKLDWGFPGVEVKITARSGGSGDPYAIIDEQDKIKLPDWRTLVDEVLNA